MKRKNFRFAAYLLLILLCFVLNSCGNKDDDGSGLLLKADLGLPLKAAESLTESDFEVPSPTVISDKYDFMNVFYGTLSFKNINKWFDISDGFFWDMPLYSERFSPCSEARYSEEKKECLEIKTSPGVFKPNGNGSFQAVFDHTNVGECLLPYEPFEVSAVLSFLYGQVKVRDAEGVEIDIENKTAHEIFDYPNDYHPAQLQYREHLHQHYEGEGYSSARSAMVSINDLSDFNSPCVISEENRISNCEIKIADRYVSNSDYFQNYNNLIVLKIYDITANPEDEYYTNGAIEFTFNNWKGVLIYGGDGGEHPAYELTDTRTGETTYGVFWIYGGYNNSLKAYAGRDRTVNAGELVQLDGVAIANADSVISYSWSFESVPSESLLTDTDIEKSDTDTPRFTPDVPGSYALNLWASDGEGEGTGDAVVVTAE